MFARRKFAIIKHLLQYAGIEPERVNFSWISSSEGTTFAQKAEEVVKTVKKLGPLKGFVKKTIEVHDV